MASSAFATTLCIAIGFCFRPAIVPGQVASAQKGQSSTSSTQSGSGGSHLLECTRFVFAVALDLGIFFQFLSVFAVVAAVMFILVNHAATSGVCAFLFVCHFRCLLSVYYQLTAIPVANSVRSEASCRERV